MTPIHVFGIGSPFGDDQAGWKVVDILLQKNTLKKFIPRFLHVETLDRPGMSLLAHFNENSIVILIDAMKSGSVVGSLYRYENPQLTVPDGLLSTHGMGVLQALQVGLALNKLPQQVILYGVEIDEIKLASSLSKPVEKAIVNLADQITDELLGWIKL